MRVEREGNGGGGRRIGGEVEVERQCDSSVERRTMSLGRERCEGEDFDLPSARPVVS